MEMNKKPNPFQKKHLGRSPLNIASRVAVGTLGAYLFAALFTTVFSLILPGNQAIAVASATLLSFVLLVSFSVWSLTANRLSNVVKTMSFMAVLLLIVWRFANA